jgi:uncharacterized protein (TIGR03067 family)
MKAQLPADSPRDPASKNDLALMQGTWQLVSAMEDGKSLAEDKVKQTTIVVKGSTFRFPELAEDATSTAGTFTLDATKKPKEMDSISAEQVVTLGIYEMKEDSYKVCFAPAGKSRPSEFASTPGSRHILQVWKRQKK